MAVSTPASLPERVSFARIPDIREMPSLIQVQIDSFEWFKREGLKELFAEISPIEDFTGKNLKLEFIVPDDAFEEPKYTEDQCRERDATYAAPLYVTVRLTYKETGVIQEKRIFMGDFPLMTKEGTFISMAPSAKSLLPGAAKCGAELCRYSELPLTLPLVVGSRSMKKH